MAFPQVVSVTETAFSSAATSHAVSLPATSSGDVLLLLFSAHNSPTVTTPSGWTLLYSDFDSNSFIRGAAYFRVADGNEGATVDVVTSIAKAGSAQVYRCTGAGNIEVTTTTAPSGTELSSPSLTPTWGAADTLWITVAHTGDDDQAVTVTPTNYASLVDTACGGGANGSGRVASARRELNALSEDPGNFTIASTESWVLATIGIEPSVGGTVAVKPSPIQRMDRGFVGHIASRLGGHLQ